MKKTFRFAAFSFAALALFAGAASAADSGAIGVSASVTGNCKITATTPAAFGALDPAAIVSATATGSVTFWCTKGSAYTLSTNNGANASGTQKRMVGPAVTDFIAYSLSLASTTGTGSGLSTPITVNANASAAPAAWANSSVGAYADTVTVSITP